MNFKNSIFSIQLILLLSSLITTLNHCDNRALPILLTSNNTCVMQYCTQEDFDNNICVKDNKIINTQWLNNIIKFGEVNGRLTKIGKYLRGDMLVFSGANPGNAFLPYFYGLKENGRPLFIKEDKETPFNCIDFGQANQGNNFGCIGYQEGEIFITKMLDNEEEYLLYFGSKNIFTELYDFQNNNILYSYTG